MKKHISKNKSFLNEYTHSSVIKKDTYYGPILEQDNPETPHIGQIYSLAIVKAACCIFVFISHFVAAFLPNSTLKGKLASMPFNIVFNGNTSVRLFFVITGIVLSYRFLKCDRRNEMFPYIVKRGIRLGIPVFVTVFAAYAMMSLGFYRHIETANLTGSAAWLATFNNFDPDFGSALREGMYGTLLGYSARYVSSLWTMTYDMLGSILVISVCCILLKHIRYRLVFYGIFLLAGRRYYWGYYLYFVIGMMITDTHINLKICKEWNKEKEILYTVLMIFAGLYICCPHNAIDTDLVVYHSFSLACFLFFESMLNCRWVERISKRLSILLRIGKISYAIYLLHFPLIQTLSCTLFLALYGVMDRNGTIVLTFIITFAVLIPLSILFNRYIEQIGNEAIEHIL